MDNYGVLFVFIRVHSWLNCLFRCPAGFSNFSASGGSLNTLDRLAGTNTAMNARYLLCSTLPLLVGAALAQTPLTISLQDAYSRARQYGGQIQSANLNVAQAHEDRVQARANTLPNVSALNQFIYTQANGTPSGVFVANDGVQIGRAHV